MTVETVSSVLERKLIHVAALVLLGLTACTTYTTRVDNAPGTPTVYTDPSSPGLVRGVGIESQDIVSMTDKMVRDMLTNKALAGRARPPRVIVDSAYFHNEGHSRINKKMITDRLRVGLNRSAAGRMVFVGRHFADMVEKERDLKRTGVVSGGTERAARAPMGADYRLGGRITSRAATKAGTAMMSLYHVITFEVVDLETGEIVWTGMYEFKKTAQDDVIYR